MTKRRARHTPRSRSRLRHSRASCRAPSEGLGLALALEQLEARQLLAGLTISESKISGGADLVYTDTESITIDPNVILNAGGGKITLTAPVIKIGDGAQLLSKGTGGVAITAQPGKNDKVGTVFSIVIDANAAIDAGGGSIAIASPNIDVRAGASLRSKGTGGAADGAITLTAKNQDPVQPLSIVDQAASFISAIMGGKKAAVKLGENLTVDGGSFTIDVQSGDPRNNATRAQTQSNWPLAGVVETVGSIFLNDLLAMPFAVIVKQPESAITVGAGASIKSSGDVSISGVANAYAVTQAGWNPIFDKITQKFGFAAGVSYSDVKASATIAENAKIEADGKVDIGTTSYSYSWMKANTGLNRGGGDPTNPDAVGVAATVLIQKAASTIDVKAGAVVAAKSNVRIDARGDDQAWGESYTLSYYDGSVGVAGGVMITNSDVRVTVDGTVTAGRVATKAALEFNPAWRVNFLTSAIELPNDVELTTGEEVVYSAKGGGAIPGLEDGATYYTIVDPANKKAVRLAKTVENARSGVAISFGAGFPTLAGAGSKGKIAIVTVTAALDDTIELDFKTWPNGDAILDGEAVTFAGGSGQFLGFNDANGQLVGSLPGGSYTIRLVPDASGLGRTRIRLIKDGNRVDLNTNPQFLAGGTILQVSGFDTNAATANLLFPDYEDGVTDRPPSQAPAVATLANAAPITYVEGFGRKIAGLENGKTYYAVVDPAKPGIIRLAETALQARASDPRVQSRSPALSFIVPATDTEPETTKTVSADFLEPGIGLGFAANPVIPDGTPVVYRAVAGRPIEGLADGTTYYAYNRVKAGMDPADPRYYVGLRAAAGTGEFVECSVSQAFEIAGVRYAIDAADPRDNLLVLGLPTRATVAAGSSVQVRDIPANTPQLWNNATGGTFTISLAAASGSVSTAAIPYNATATQVRSAINKLGIVGTEVTEAFGTGRSGSPWTLVGKGLDSMSFDDSNLTGGIGRGGFTNGPMQAVWTDASSGTVTLGLNVNGSTLTSSAIDVGAAADVVQAALAALPGVAATVQEGAGTAANPWLVGVWRQPLQTGAAAIFRDGWGQSSLGFVDGETYFLVVRAASGDSLFGQVAVGFAATAENAAANTPQLLGLGTTITFGRQSATPGAASRSMSGTKHALSPTVAGSIQITSSARFIESQWVGTWTGGAPNVLDLLGKRRDMLISKVLVGGGGAFLKGFGRWWQSVEQWKFFKDGAKNLGKALADPFKEIPPQGGATVEDQLGLSASFSVVVANRSVRTIIGEHAKLITSGTVVVSSRLHEQFQTNADSGVSKPDATKAAVALAVNVALVNTTCQTIVQSNAEITGGDGVAISSRVDYPWFGRNMRDIWATGLTPGTEAEVGNWFSKAVGTFTEFDNQMGIHGAYSATDVSGPNPSAKIGTAVAGSTYVVLIGNTCETIVEDGVQINQDAEATKLAGALPVSITAATQMEQAGLAGQIPLPGWIGRVPVGAVIGAGGVASDATNGLGFSVGYFGLTNTTRAVLGGQASLAEGNTRTPAAATNVTFGSGGLSVTADNWVVFVQTAVSGATATNFGFSGTASVFDAARSPQVVEAAILPKAALTPQIRRRDGTDGDVRVTAEDGSYLIPIAGTINIGAEKMVGVSTGIALVDRDVTARIGSRRTEESNNPVTLDVDGAVSIDTAGDVTVTANASGAITPTAIAGGVKSSSANDSKSGSLSNFLENEFVTIDRIGVGISGAVAISRVDDTVSATVNHSGTMTGAGTAKLAVAAANTTTLLANAGGLTYRRVGAEEKASVGLSGAVAVIAAGSRVEASVRRASIDGYSLDVTARNARVIGGTSLSVAGGTVGDQGSLTVNFAGSGTGQSLTTTTLAIVEGVTGTSLRGATVAAMTSDRVITIAGSFVGNVSSIFSGNSSVLPSTGSGRSVGVGASVAVVKATHTTKAVITNSVLTFAEGNLGVTATESSTAVTVAGGGTYVNTGGSALANYGGSGGSTAAGMVAVVSFDPTVEASITGSTAVHHRIGGVFPGDFSDGGT
jgi:hypothetical protein